MLLPVLSFAVDGATPVERGHTGSIVVDTSTGSSRVVSIRERIAAFKTALSAEELATILGVSPITVYKHAKKGRIPSYRIGTCVRFCPKAAVEWLDRNQAA